MEEESQPELEQESRKRMKVEEPPEDVLAEEVTEEVTEEGLPEDFFDEGSRPAKVGVDEDEWIKFQTEIQETIRNQEEGDLEDEEEMRRGIAEEFDELNTLEDRVERLKKRRAELQKDKDSKPVIMKDVAVADEDEDADAEEEEWW
jgi:hypothetical protein